MKLNVHWPSTEGNTYVAWYTILWRAPFQVIIYIGLAFTWFGCVCSYGLSHANNWWQTARRG